MCIHKNSSLLFFCFLFDQTFGDIRFYFLPAYQRIAIVISATAFNQKCTTICAKDRWLSLGGLLLDMCSGRWLCGPGLVFFGPHD
jgi:hypothetical protein